MTVTVLKSYPKRNNLKSYLIGTLENSQPMTLEYKFCEIFQFYTSSGSPSLDLYVDILIRALDIYAPKKKKHLRANNSPFMNKISKEVSKK